jgi:hypothetical protein
MLYYEYKQGWKCVGLLQLNTHIFQTCYLLSVIAVYCYKATVARSRIRNCGPDFRVFCWSSHRNIQIQIIKFNENCIVMY